MPGGQARAQLQRQEATWQCCSMPTRTAVPGAQSLACAGSCCAHGSRQKTAAACILCSIQAVEPSALQLSPRGRCSVALRLRQQEGWFFLTFLTQLTGTADDQVADSQQALHTLLTVLSDFLQDVKLACRRYTDDLLEACLELLLAAPAALMPAQV